MWRHILNIICLFVYYIYMTTYIEHYLFVWLLYIWRHISNINIYMFYYIYYVLFNDNSYKTIVIIAVYDTSVMIFMSFQDVFNWANIVDLVAEFRQFPSRLPSVWSTMSCKNPGISPIQGRSISPNSSSPVWIDAVVGSNSTTSIIAKHFSSCRATSIESQPHLHNKSLIDKQMLFLYWDILFHLPMWCSWWNKNCCSIFDSVAFTKAY